MAGWIMKTLRTIIIITVIVFIIRLILHWHFKCNMPSVVTQLCSAYKAGQVSGPLCPDLCEQNNIHLGKCLTSVPDKKIYVGEWRGRSVIIKVNMSWFEEFEQRQKLTDSEVESSFQTDVQSRVDTLFGNCSRCKELVSLLQFLGDGDSDGSVTAAEARTFVSLLQHVEPTMLIALNKSTHTVDFYGYCGGLYAVEKVPSVASDVFDDTWEILELAFLPDEFEPFQDFFNYNLGNLLNAAARSMLYINNKVFDNVINITHYPIFRKFVRVYGTSKRERFEFAYSLLDATLDVAVSPYGLTQSCDVHQGNYGITDNSTVKLIDVDLLYPHVFLRGLLKEKRCVSDLECFAGSFHDCWSSCDTVTGTCQSLLGIQDLHMICEALFPMLFTRPNIHDSKDNLTCLEKEIKKLAEFCSKMPVVYSARDLRHNILTVKKRLKSVELKYTESCQ